MARKPDIGITVTDLFCGAGGSSLGALFAGLVPYLALNHWDIAIRTHNMNFPDCRHDCRDVQATDPRRYPSTDVLLASPECTNHSLAKGKKRPHYTADLFGTQLIKPEDERSRATMWDVVRFAEYHDYRVVIVENVVDAYNWIPFPSWLDSMDRLGYDHEIVFFNSQFAFPTPQSRDRMYVVFWKRGLPKPDLNFTPPAPCSHCNKVVEGRQTWKNTNKRNFKRWGRYKSQYIYTCPNCRNEVVPFYFAAMNAIDWSIPAERIGDRKTPLKPKTMQRIQYGLDKYGRNPLIISPRYGHGLNHRVHDASEEPLPTQPADSSHAVSYPFLFQNNEGERVRDASGDPLPTQTTARGIVGLINPFLIQTSHTKGNGKYTNDGTAPTFTQTSTQDMGIVAPFNIHMSSSHFADSGATEPLPTQTCSEYMAVVTPSIINMSHTHAGDKKVTGGDDPSPTHTTRGNLAVVGLAAGFLSPSGRRQNPTDVVAPTGTLTSVEHHGLVGIPPQVVSVNDFDPRTLDGTQQALGTLTTGEKWAVSAPSFIAEMHGTSKAGAITEPLMCVMTGSHHGLVTVANLNHYLLATGQPMEVEALSAKLAHLTVEDLTFRMLKEWEIGKAMAFPGWYQMHGNTSQRIKQYGNAVTPPVSSMLLERVLHMFEK